MKSNTVKKKIDELELFIKRTSDKIKYLQSKCDHKDSVTYYPDPSGNNDSTYYCSCCKISFNKDPRGN